MDALDKYVQSIKYYPRIDKAREKVLAGIIRRSKNTVNVEKAKEELIHSNLLLVVDRALKMKSRYCFVPIGIMEFVSEGNVGLMRAVNSYRGDHKSKAGFATYAIMGIDQKMINLVKMDKLIHLPHHYLDLRAALYKLEQKYGRGLTDEEIKEKLSVTKEMLEALRNDKNVHVSHLEDKFTGDDGEASVWNDILEDTKTISPDETAVKNSLTEHLRKYMSNLRPKEKIIIEERYLSGHGATLEELGVILKVSRERVRQMLASAFRNLRRSIATDWQAKYGEPPPKMPINYRDFNGWGSYYARLDQQRQEIGHKAFKHLLNGDSK